MVTINWQVSDPENVPRFPLEYLCMTYLLPSACKFKAALLSPDCTAEFPLVRVYLYCYSGWQKLGGNLKLMY